MRNNLSRRKETRSEAFEQKTVQRNRRIHCHFGYADRDPYGEDAEEW